jgi:chemotaxis protein methyltransferase CheR
VISVEDPRLELISSLIYRKFGIRTGKDKYERLSLRLGDMIQRGYCRDVDELCTRLSGGDERCFGELAAFVTTCHTYFFREPEQFGAVASDIRRRGDTGALIWCAACSTGEEPYSLAMKLLDEGISGFHIVASDVNRTVLEVFNRGIYHESRFIRTSGGERDRYFTPAGEGYWRIDGRLRKYISIKNLNLMERVHFPRPFDYVFCRNVFIYFDGGSRAAALGNITENMKTGGLLFIGQAEVLLSEPEKLTKAGCSVYRRTA